MSSRVLKKLHGDNNQLCDDELSDEIELGLVGAKKKQFNLNRYDLLNQQSPSESEVKEDDNETEHASAANNSVCNLSKKKKKKRKKKSTKQSVQRRSSEDNADIDDIVRTVTDVDHFLGKHYKTSVTAQRCDGNKYLLSVQNKHLNPQYEMRRTFGCRVVQAEQNKRRNFRGTRQMLKTTWLANAKETWPPVSHTGIYMNVAQAPDGLQNKNVIWFSFEHNASYRQYQLLFLSAVESMDSDNIIRIINRQPYHVDALIQLSELCKMTEDHAMASELIERAILALESAFHSMFSLTSGNCRLDYRKQENRSFFIVLFKHAQYLEGRACGRTALEISKLILNLDPETDPLAMILVIDYYALRSKQYEWLVSFYNEYNAVKNLLQLPNMAYSYALSLFYLQGDSEESNTALQYALMMFPGVLRPLLEELSIQTDPRVTSHNFFGPSSVTGQSPALFQLVSLYICRSKLIWRDPDILPWLEKNVSTVLDRVDKKDEIVNEYHLKRTQRYVNPPRAILRHIILSDFKEKVPLAPFINKEKDPIVMYDPLPPLDSINTYDRKPSTNSISNSTNTPVSMFFQSILPTFNLHGEENRGIGGGPVVAGGRLNRQPEANNVNVENMDEEGAAAIATGIQSYRELRNSLTSIVDAMRDFLSNIRIPERPNDADIDEDESSEDETTDYLT